METAGALLADDEIAIAQQTLIDVGLVRALLENVDRDLVVPEAHVAPLAARRLLIRGRGVDDWNVLRTTRIEQALHRGDDDVHLVARERVVGTSPRIGEIDVEDRGAGTEADPALEAPCLIQLRILGEDFVEHLL